MVYVHEKLHQRRGNFFYKESIRNRAEGAKKKLRPPLGPPTNRCPAPPPHRPVINNIAPQEFAPPPPNKRQSPLHQLIMNTQLEKWSLVLKGLLFLVRTSSLRTFPAIHGRRCFSRCLPAKSAKAGNPQAGIRPV